ncbi:hypothetical protein BYT27DRAFT_7197300 [Phlegmacium glaucopus]|nr:hypothetical protein BYT27DRAFT_7197300 [Phlegmacium glaucopus]
MEYTRLVRATDEHETVDKLRNPVTQDPSFPAVTVKIKSTALYFNPFCLVTIHFLCPYPHIFCI